MITYQHSRWVRQRGHDRLRLALADGQERGPDLVWSLECKGFAEAFCPPGQPRLVPTPSLAVEITNLPLDLADWRAWENRDLRINPDWILQREFITHDGQLVDAQLSGQSYWPDARADHPHFGMPGEFRSLDFDLHFGSRDGRTFVCELEGWTEPLPGSGITQRKPWQRQRTGPPDLCIATQVQLDCLHVQVEAHTEDPIAEARRRLWQRLRLSEPGEASVFWAQRLLANGQGHEPIPNSRCTVTFVQRKT